VSELRVTERELRDLLVTQLEVLEPPAFDAAVAASKRLRIPLERAVLERARVPLSFLLEHLARSWNVGFIDLKINDVRPQAMQKLREEYARQRQVVAFDSGPQGLSVAMANPRDQETVAGLRQLTGLTIVPHLAPLEAIRRAHLLYSPGLRTLLARPGGAAAKPVAKTGSGEPPAADLVNQMLEYAVVTGASDIHIEPYELETIIRCRVDGVLQEVLTLSPAALPSLIARIKVLAGMRIDEKRAPQDGRFEIDLGGLQVNLRVSSMPTYWAEKIVMRVLAKDSATLELEDLGLAATDFPIVVRHIMRPFGMILITGPTGSGKTTSLYAMIARVGLERNNVVNISTIEDPIERPLPRVSQIGLNAGAGIDFAGGLRALLRQDPDILMVGEVRDRETADIAVRAALVGRLLLSTLHTNDAVGAVPRLLDMGVEPFLLASTLELVISQRLARRVCTGCRESLTRDAHLQDVLRAVPGLSAAIPALQTQGVLPSSGDPLAGVRLYRGRGCAQCGGTGFRGRIGLFEILEVDENIRRLISERRDAAVIRAAAMQAGMKTMFQDALAKMFLGETTIEEVVRVTA